MMLQIFIVVLKSEKRDSITELYCLSNPHCVSLQQVIQYITFQRNIEVTSRNKNSDIGLLLL